MITNSITVLDGKCVYWAAVNGTHSVFLVMDQAATTPARYVDADGTVTPASGEPAGLVRYGTPVRPVAFAVAAEATPEYAGLFARIAAGEGVSTWGEPERLYLRDIADEYGIAYVTAKSYKATGRLPVPDGYSGRSPYWYWQTIERHRHTEEER